MAYQFRTTKILIVESTRAMFDLTKGVLDTYGVGQVVSAYDCDSGFAQFCRHNPDIVIVDWLTEPGNGLELTRRIRQEKESPNPFVPIVMMTGFSQMKRVIMARDSGITEFLVKPFTSKTLAHRIEQLIEKPRLFVRAPGYFGPDRRRRQEMYDPPDRRLNKEEVVPATSMKAEPAAVMRAAMEEKDQSSALRKVGRS